ncbi:hypothetical protein [Streptomyces smaragdinus]|nr:hypothetical protein [Streptomyces smaragdinus]
MAPEAELLLSKEVGGAAEDLVREVAGHGYTVRTRQVLDHRAAEELTWLVLLALPLQAFLSGLGAGAATGVQNAVARLVARIRPPEPVPEERPRPVPLVLQDPTTELRIVVEAGLPAEAYEQLLTLDLASFRIGPLHYDRDAGRWRSELDEAAAG